MIFLNVSSDNLFVHQDNILRLMIYSYSLSAKKRIDFLSII